MSKRLVGFDFDPYDKSDAEKAEAIAKGIVGDGTRCPRCKVSFARWLLGKECQSKPHRWHEVRTP